MNVTVKIAPDIMLATFNPDNPNYPKNVEPMMAWLTDEIMPYTPIQRVRYQDGSIVVECNEDTDTARVEEIVSQYFR